MDVYVVDSDLWHDFRKVTRKKGLDNDYNVEDCEGGSSVEYHAYSYLAQAVDIL